MITKPTGIVFRASNILGTRHKTSVIIDNLIESCYNQYLLNTVWTRVKSNNDMIGYAASISVSVSCSRCDVLALTSCFMTWLYCVLWTYSSWTLCIYSVDTVLYPYALPIDHTPIPFSSLCLSCNLSQSLRS